MEMRQEGLLHGYRIVERRYGKNVRHSIVSFVNLKGLHSTLILDTAAVLVQEEARFAQTRVGWILRGLSHVYPDQVFEFLQQHQEHVSVECMRMATARLSDKKRKGIGSDVKAKTKAATIP